MTKQEENNILHISVEDILKHQAYDYTDGDIVLLENVQSIRTSDLVHLDAVTLILCTEGRMCIDMDDVVYELKKNDLLLSSPTRVTRNVPNEDTCQYKVICLSPRILGQGVSYERTVWERSFYLSKNPLMHLTDFQVDQFLEYYRMLKLKLRNPSTFYHKEIMFSLLQAMLYELLSYLDGMVASSESGYLRQGEFLFKRFIKLLSEKEVKPRFVYYYADQLHVSTKYLSAVCKTVCGRTAGDLIDEFVMRDVVRLLKHSDKSIKEISLQLDFPNISFFGKYVKAHLGMSPKAYRKKEAI